MISAFLGVSLASEASFLSFTKTFNKRYASVEEFEKRREIFLHNYADMVEHNEQYEAGAVSWWRKVTEYYDMTHQEWMDIMKLGMPPLDEALMVNTVDKEMEERIAAKAAPSEWSWVDQNAVSSIKNQVNFYDSKLKVKKTLCF